ncbi:hypothetical protein KUV26_07215 [Leisingera daeponensis]|uniref:Uncharacterized protein n=1 Tax=Leisingera daeponensis TaxID=405746 RepID=A0ABS7NED4_9RHOB|nr:hypothetical protein [Leisingera daeponensis]MBY6139226.1 hypothetical protein [Leisingera daeponensis]
MLDGWEGKTSFAGLLSGAVELPLEQGVYAVEIPRCFKVSFLPCSTGGRFKGRDPTVPIRRLQEKWVEGADILYFGKAGGTGLRTTLKDRILLYAKFGAGRPVGHYGGRLIWQLAGAMDLTVQWKRTSEEPRLAEKCLISAFLGEYGKLPFANMTR